MNTALAGAARDDQRGSVRRGWMIVLKLADPSAVDGLMDAAAYQALVARETK